MPAIKFNFVPLESLKGMTKDSIVGELFLPRSFLAPHFTYLDVIGIVKESGPLDEITSKTTQRKVCQYACSLASTNFA